MLDRHPLDAARKVGLPVGLVAGDLRNDAPFRRGQVLVPTELLEHGHRELRIAVLDLGIDRITAVGKKIFAVPLDPESGPEAQAAFGNRFRGIVEDMGARMFHLRCAPAWPR